YENTRDLDNGIDILTHQLSQYNPEALLDMKKMFWEGTEHWDTLLIERAEISCCIRLPVSFNSSSSFASLSCASASSF
ncbi:hypothetical protein MUP37_06955, partial [Candidatus Bathyarchaeota archaeon]|nr:hypothetical protein [Candidatus Bathyarchaeota archaeon]